MRAPRSRRDLTHPERVERLLKWMLVSVVVLVFATWLSGYLGRWDIVLGQRSACEARKADQALEARFGWRPAEQARRAEGRVVTADQYDTLATRLERRSRENCADRYGAPPIVPLP